MQCKHQGILNSPGILQYERQQDVPTSWQALAFGRTASSTSLERDASAMCLRRRSHRPGFDEQLHLATRQQTSNLPGEPCSHVYMALVSATPKIGFLREVGSFRVVTTLHDAASENISLINCRNVVASEYRPVLFPP